MGCKIYRVAGLFSLASVEHPIVVDDPRAYGFADLHLQLAEMGR
jgi:hypothetical protein